MVVDISTETFHGIAPLPYDQRQIHAGRYKRPSKISGMHWTTNYTMPACTPPLREALNYSISSGWFTDTKVILYSRRNASGIISKPKALYANSHVLKSVPYFSDRKF